MVTSSDILSVKELVATVILMRLFTLVLGTYVPTFSALRTNNSCSGSGALVCDAGTVTNQLRNRKSVR